MPMINASTFFRSSSSGHLWRSIDSCGVRLEP
jgi:hypothetical protein